MIIRAAGESKAAPWLDAAAVGWIRPGMPDDPKYASRRPGLRCWRAITCGAGVYIWSQNAGLALIIALAMILSMFIAAVSGALVPIMLKRMGQDPALCASITLTTVTDIAGFMSFLGIATMLSGVLEAG